MSFLSSLMNALPGAAAQGLAWGIMAIGVYITFRILDVADLTVDGSLATGGAVCVMLIRGGFNPWIALLCAMLAGMLAGLVTGLFHTRCGIPAILAGILTQLALYSINLRIMDSKANQALSVDKYPLLLSQRYVRELSMNNPRRCCFSSQPRSSPSCTGSSARRRAAHCARPAQTPTWRAHRASTRTRISCLA